MQIVSSICMKCQRIFTSFTRLKGLDLQIYAFWHCEGNEQEIYIIRLYHYKTLLL